MVSGLNSLPGFHCPMPAGAFYAFPNIKQITHDDKKLASFLLEEGNVAAIGGSCFGEVGRGYMRFSYANSLENIALAIERMREALPRFR
jgi:aspartate/methionine/tyrosine aminotransferase